MHPKKYLFLKYDKKILKIIRILNDKFSLTNLYLL